MRAPNEPANALRHPLFWLSLVVLVVNDHLLKGAGVLPALVTGKLSDLSGLIVAPLLSAALFRARSRRARAAAFALVAVPFGAINVSPAAAALAEDATAALGVPWTVWCDPTDLVALAALPVAWWIAARGGAAAPARRAVVERAALVLGALACMATSKVDPPPEATFFYQTSAFAVNRTEETLDVRVRWFDADVDCEAVAADPARALSPRLFGEGVTVTLAPNEVMPLARDAALTAVGAAPGPWADRTVGCEAALVQSDGLPATVVFWRDFGPRDVVTPLPADGDMWGGVALLPDGDGLRAEGQALTVAPAVDLAEPSECLDAAPVTFEWSAAGLPSFGSYRLDAVDVGPDGCTALALADVIDDAPYLAFVCAPDWAVPFTPGDTVHVRTSAVTLRIAREHPDASFGDELVLASFSGGVSLDAVSGTLVPSTSCAGDRSACDAYVRQASLEIDGAPGALAPGHSREIGTDGFGRRVTVALGRTEEVFVAHEGCEAARATLGRRGSALVLYEEVIE